MRVLIAPYIAMVAADAQILVVEVGGACLGTGPAVQVSGIFDDPRSAASHIVYQRKLIYVSKLKAARDQVDEAIWMFFRRRSEVAIHTIVGAAHRLLIDLTDQEPSLIKPPGTAREHINHLNTYFNFFKHADQDKDTIIVFQTHHLTHHLYDCVRMHLALTGKRPHSHAVYEAWMHIAHPDLVSSETTRDQVLRLAEIGYDPNDFDLYARWADGEF